VIRGVPVAVVVEPSADLDRVEAHEVTNLQVRDPVLLDEAAKVADAVLEPGRELFVIQERRFRRLLSRDEAHGFS
jgi:hypothetical protein